jgi:phage terminase large subunit
MAAVHGLRCAEAGELGVVVCGREFMNSLDESSLAEVKAAILEEPWLAAKYDVGDKYVRTKDRRIDFAFAGLRHNLDSIKSKSRIRLLWVDEAEPVSETAWSKAIPTVREDGSEIWVTWNPERKQSATHKRFRDDPPIGAKIVKMNWRDNPWFPATLQKTRLEDLNKRPDQYEHIWEGGFVSVVEGAYYAKSLSQARLEKRIGHVARDPLMQLRAFWDLGVRDATAIWIAQFVGREIRVLDYYEAVGQPLAAHLEWLRSNGYGSALCVLPHDGSQSDQITAKRFEDHIRGAGFEVRTVVNQGKGAALKRVEAARRLFPSIWINEQTCSAGLDALGWYHEKRDDERNIGLGPEHDWASHGADAFGLMCVAYEEPKTTDKGWKHVARKVA